VSPTSIFDKEVVDQCIKQMDKIATQNDDDVQDDGKYQD
jgi:hypothetical protein